MRDLDRIEPFLKEFGEIWKEEFPDWRYLQLMSNFCGWVVSEKGKDIFFIEEDECLKYFKEFAGIKD